MALTARQSQIVEFVAKYRRERGFSPTQKEIAQHLQIGICSVRGHLDSLEIKSVIKREGVKARNLVVA